MTPQEFLDEFGTLAESAQGVPKLRELILDLAVRGQLTTRLDDDEPVPQLTERIDARRAELVKAKTIRGKVPLRDSKLPEDAIPAGWEWHSFGNVTFNRDGDRIPVRKGDRESQPKIYDYYGASGVIDQVEKYLFDQPLLLIGEDGANLINRATPIAFIAEGKYWVNNHAHVVDAISREMLEYIRVYFASIRLEPYITGMAQPKMNQARMNSIPIPVPPIEEQHRIVSKVDELMGLCDRLEAVQGQRRGVRVRLNRASLDRLTSVSGVDRAGRSGLSAAWQRVCDHFEVLYDTPETLPDLRQTILQLAVQGKLVPQDPNDEPATVNEPCVASEIAELPEIPDSWSYVRLKHLSHRVSVGHVGPTSQHYCNQEEDGIPFLRSQNVRPWRVNLDGIRYITREFHESLKKSQLSADDLLFVRVGANRGDCCTVPEGFDALNCANIVFARLKEPNEYIELYCQSHLARTLLMGMTTGSAQGVINTKSVAELRIPLPPLSEQKRIVSKVTHLLSQVTRLESTLTRRESTRTQLLIAAIHSLLNPEASS